MANQYRKVTDAEFPIGAPVYVTDAAGKGHSGFVINMEPKSQWRTVEYLDNSRRGNTYRAGRRYNHATRVRECVLAWTLSTPRGGGMNCPLCDGAIHFEKTETEVPVFVPNRWGKNYVEMRPTPATVAFCNSCEWAHEIKPEFLKGRVVCE